MYDAAAVIHTVQSLLNENKCIHTRLLLRMEYRVCSLLH